MVFVSLFSMGGALFLANAAVIKETKMPIRTFIQMYCSDKFIGVSNSCICSAVANDFKFISSKSLKLSWISPLKNQD